MDAPECGNGAGPEGRQKFVYKLGLIDLLAIRPMPRISVSQTFLCRGPVTSIAEAVRTFVIKFYFKKVEVDQGLNTTSQVQMHFGLNFSLYRLKFSRPFVQLEIQNVILYHAYSRLVRNLRYNIKLSGLTPRPGN